MPPLGGADVPSFGASGYGRNTYVRPESRPDARFRTQVCRYKYVYLSTELRKQSVGSHACIIFTSYWLIGMCQKGSECGHLHQLVKAKCPVCNQGKRCRIKNCLLQHMAEEDRIECMFFRQGFCLNGPDCKFRHVLKSPEECPAKASFTESSNSQNL